MTTTPAATVTFSYKGDDADTPADADFQGVRYRHRRLSDGATTTSPQVSCPGNGDNATKTLNVSFPDRGRWVVEAELLDGGNCGDNDNSGKWYWVGAVDVNSPVATSPTLSLDVPRPAITARRSPRRPRPPTSDAGDGGTMQKIEWDLDKRERLLRIRVARRSGVRTDRGTEQRTINTTGMTPGDHTIRARVTDNGAIERSRQLAQAEVHPGDLPRRPRHRSLGAVRNDRRRGRRGDRPGGHRRRQRPARVLDPEWAVPRNAHRHRRDAHVHAGPGLRRPGPVHLPGRRRLTAAPTGAHRDLRCHPTRRSPPARTGRPTRQDPSFEFRRRTA